MLRIVLGDDHEVFRQGLAKLFEGHDDIQLVGHVSNGHELIELVKSEQTDIALVDVSMPGPGMCGICEAIEALSVPTKVIVLTMHEDATLAQEALAAGAHGFVIKRNAFREIQDALQCVQRGETFVSPTITARTMVPAGGGSQRLTVRELEVVRLVADGLSNQRIAKQLGISIKTVQTHRARAMEKLEVHSAAALVRRLADAGLLVELRRDGGAETEQRPH